MIPIPPTNVVIAMYAIRFGLEAAQELVKVFDIKEPVPADWDGVWAASQKSLNDEIAEAAKRLGVPLAPGLLE